MLLQLLMHHLRDFLVFLLLVVLHCLTSDVHSRRRVSYHPHHILLSNSISQLGSSLDGNVAVRYTIWHPVIASSQSSSTFGPRVCEEPSTTWLLSTTIPSSCLVASLWLMNLSNAFVTALSVVTNTILACLAAWSGYPPALSPTSRYRLSRSLRSEINGTITTVVPPEEQNTSSMNIKLLPLLSS